MLCEGHMKTKAIWNHWWMVSYPGQVLTLSNESARNKQQFKTRNFKVQEYFSDLGPGFSVGRLSMVLEFLPVLPLFCILCCFLPLPSEQGEGMINSYKLKVCWKALKWITKLLGTGLEGGGWARIFCVFQLSLPTMSPVWIIGNGIY